jgi:ribosome-binding protein aMBF1 (putative translation factor)
MQKSSFLRRSFAANLRREREALGLSQQALANCRNEIEGKGPRRLAS